MFDKDELDENGKDKNIAEADIEDCLAWHYKLLEN